MGVPSKPDRPYAAVHRDPQGPGDARPTAMQVVRDLNAERSLERRTVVITGASSGLGLETARVLYETGARLILTARDIPKLEKAIDGIVNNSGAYPRDSISKPQKPVAIEMHLDSLASVRSAANEILQQTSKISILVLNAGVMESPLSYTPDDFEMHMGTNHMSHSLLFHLLNQPIPSRIIILSSDAHRMSPLNFSDMHWRDTAYNKWKAYGQSKPAGICMANAIARRYHIPAVSLCPGPVDTDLSKHMDEEDWRVMGGKQRVVPERKSVEQGAATTVWAALSPQFEGLGEGRYLTEVGEVGSFGEGWKVGSAEWAFDEEGEERLWRVSCEAVGAGVS